MKDSTPEVLASIMSELLLYHAALGRGFISPFPATKGLVYTSALPKGALSHLLEAESQFTRWHNDAIADDKKQLKELEGQAKETLAVTGGVENLQKLKDSVAKLPNVTWKEEGAIKATFVELMKKSYYGAITCIDQVGGRLALALLHTMRLANDINLYTLTEGTSDEAFIRANATGGANIHSLAGRGAIFNFFSSCKESQIDDLIDRVKHAKSGAHGQGVIVAIHGKSDGVANTTPDTLYKLMTNVYARGSKDPDKWVKVQYKRGTEAAWDKFVNWELRDMIEVAEPTDWQYKLASDSPASVTTSVLFGARAAMTNAFLAAAEASPTGVFHEVELNEEHLTAAKMFARLIYIRASGHESMTRRVDNLRPNLHNRITPQKLAVAKQAMHEAIYASNDGKISRDSVRRSVAGVTLGLLDELVRNGDVYELRGVAECGMGRTTRAYVLPQDAPQVDAIEALEEFREAEQNYKEDPHGYDEADAMNVYASLQTKADVNNRRIFLPAVPLSMMSSQELKLLPKLLEMYPKSLLLRGVDREPEPEAVMDEEDGLDTDGMNLWVRYKPNSSEEFYDWQKAGKLQLAEHWDEVMPDEDEPSHVPN